MIPDPRIPGLLLVHNGKWQWKPASATNEVLELLLLDGAPCELLSSTAAAIFNAHLIANNRKMCFGALSLRWLRCYDE